MLIYLGLMPHPFIPQGSLHAKIAIRSAISFIIYGFIVLLVPWPRLVTYFCAVLVCKTIIDLILGLLGIGMYGNMVESRVNLKSNGTYLTSKIFVFGLFVGLCAYLFGF